MKPNLSRRELPLVLPLSGKKPLQIALHDALRDAVLEGRLAPGRRLPATRDLARQLGVARGTVVIAYELLVAEGYFRGARGAGTFVVETLPDTWFTPEKTGSSKPPRCRTVALSERGSTLARSPMLSAPLTPARPFRPHTPAIEPFPRARWMQLVARNARRSVASHLRDIDVRGFPPLRAALAEHLRSTRAMRVNADQIVIVSGVHQALDLVARLLLNPGDRVWFEDPGYFGARHVLEAAGVELVPIPVDAEGLDVDYAIAKAPRARFAYVTPAHQAPTGATLSLERRMRLLDWAHRADAWVFEDDYDSEFRYEGRPLPALQGLDDREVVIHAGTFSKALFPGLRLAYVVLPDALVEPFSGALATLHRYQPLLSQRVLTDFIVEGDFGRHLRRMRALYAERRETLIEALSSEVGDATEIVGNNSGFEVLVRLESHVSDRLVREEALAAGVELIALSEYAIRPLERGGLLLGFAAVSPARIRRAVPDLRRAIEAAARRKA